MIEKYGVADPKANQKAELETVKERLIDAKRPAASPDMDKHAADKVSQLEARRKELEAAIAQE